MNNETINEFGFLMLSWIIKPSFFFFFFWDKDVATCNPFTQRLPTIECLLLFADTLKLLSSLSWTRITFSLSFMAEAVAHKLSPKRQKMNNETINEFGFLMLSWIIKPSFFFFFFWDKDVATCNPFTQRLPTIECLLLFADTLKLLSSLSWTRITFLLSFMAEAVALLPPWTTIKWKMCYQGWARKRDLPEIEECSLVFGRSLYGSDG